MKRVGLDYSVRLLLTHEQYNRDQDCDGDSCLLEATILGFEFPYAFDKGLEIKVVRLHHTSCWLHSLTLREGRTKRNVGACLQRERREQQAVRKHSVQMLNRLA